MKRRNIYWRKLANIDFMKYQNLSLVLPCYNLEKIIYQNIKTVHECLASQFGEYQIIVVNDGSLDATQAELEKARHDFGITVVHYPENRGKGYAVRQGVARAKHEIVGFLDADLIIPMHELAVFVECIESGYDLAIASRLRPGGRVSIPVLQHRLLMEKIFRCLRIMIIGVSKVRDTQCGCKFFTKKVAEDLFPLMRVNRFSFDAELIFLAQKRGYQIEEVPITLQNPVPSSVRILRDSLVMLRDLFCIRWFDMKGYYQPAPRGGQSWWKDANCHITFDDFGLSPKTNRNILTLVSVLPRTRVAVLMNGNFSQDEKEQLIASKAVLDIHLDRDTHLNIPSKGSFVLRIVGFLHSRKQPKEVADIWRQQLEAFERAFGKYPEAITTHEHVHFFPSYFQKLLAVAKEAGVSDIRLAQHSSRSYTPIALILNILRRVNRESFRKSGLRTTEYLLSWDWLASLAHPQKEIAHYLRLGSTEVIFHLEHDEEFVFLKQLAS